MFVRNTEDLVIFFNKKHSVVLTEYIPPNIQHTFENEWDPQKWQRQLCIIENMTRLTS